MFRCSSLLRSVVGWRSVDVSLLTRSSLHSSSSSSPRHQLHRLTSEQTLSLRDKLSAIVGTSAQQISLAEAVRSQHGQDEGPDLGEKPDLVVFPSTVEEVSAVLRVCNEERVAVVPFGTGTGLEAGVSALNGGVCVDVTKMEDITDYHPLDFDVCVQPGVTREGLNHFVKDDGLWFPVDPGANASICGMCATSASGTNAVRYGTIRENCLNLEVVLPDGRIMWTGGEKSRPKKTSAGYDLTHLFLGSEGTLGIITKAVMKLHAQPESTSVAVVRFPSIQDAINTAVSVLQCSIPIARMELLDPLSIKACNAYSKLELKETPTLFLEFHGSEDGLKGQTEVVGDIAMENNGSDFEWATLMEERNKLWTARHKLYYAALNMKPGCRSVTTDACVPVSQLPDMIEQTREDIDKSGLLGPLFGHVGDGNFHVFLLHDPNDAEEYKKCKEVAFRMASRAIDMGGTCTGEHGIGTGKKSLLRAQLGDIALDTMWSIKKAIDPNGIMNPGKVLPEL